MRENDFDRQQAINNIHRDTAMAKFRDFYLARNSAERRAIKDYVGRVAGPEMESIEKHIEFLDSIGNNQNTMFGCMFALSHFVVDGHGVLIEEDYQVPPVVLFEAIKCWDTDQPYVPLNPLDLHDEN